MSDSFISSARPLFFPALETWGTIPKKLEQIRNNPGLLIFMNGE
jgi:hypothetical protein